MQLMLAQRFRAGKRSSPVLRHFHPGSAIKRRTRALQHRAPIPAPFLQTDMLRGPMPVRARLSSGAGPSEYPGNHRAPTSWRFRSTRMSSTDVGIKPVTMGGARGKTCRFSSVVAASTGGSDGGSNGMYDLHFNLARITLNRMEKSPGMGLRGVCPHPHRHYPQTLGRRPGQASHWRQRWRRGRGRG